MQATDEPIFFLHFVLPAIRACVQWPSDPSGGDRGGEDVFERLTTVGGAPPLNPPPSPPPPPPLPVFEGCLRGVREACA